MLTNEELIEKIQDARNKNKFPEVEELVATLFEKNIGLIKTAIKGYKLAYAKNVHDAEDIESEAKTGFYVALLTYDSSKGMFSTWAFLQMKKYLKEWKNNNNLIRIPKQLQLLTRKYDRIVEEYRLQNNNEYPTSEYILYELNKNHYITNKKLDDIIAAKKAQYFSSINIENKDGDNKNDCIERVDIADNTNSVEDDVIINDERIKIEELINRLPLIEQKVVYAKFYENKTFVEIGIELGYKNKQNVYQILHRAKKHLLEMKEINEIGKNYGWLSEK